MHAAKVGRFRLLGYTYIGYRTSGGDFAQTLGFGVFAPKLRLHSIENLSDPDGAPIAHRAFVDANATLRLACTMKVVCVMGGKKGLDTLDPVRATGTRASYVCVYIYM